MGMQVGHVEAAGSFGRQLHGGRTSAMPTARQALIAALDRSADGSAVDLLALETTAVARRFK